MSVDWNEATRAMIDEIRTHGRPQTGWRAGQQVLLLTTTGAKSGEARTSPLAYSLDDGSFVVTASKAGASTHPAWYHNLLSEPKAVVELDRERIPVEATLLPEGPERQRLWDQHVAIHPGIAEYPKKTDRVIPIVVLRRIGVDSTG